MTYLITKLPHFSPISIDPLEFDRFLPSFDIVQNDLATSTRTYLDICNTKIEDCITKKFKPVDVCRVRSLMIDRMIVGLFERCRLEMSGERDVTILAVGGYGREEMSLHSDIDLLFLYENKSQDSVKKMAEKVLYLLWDLKLEVGHSIRNLSDSRKMMQADQTIFTSLLDARFLCGDKKLYDSFLKMRRSLLKSRRIQDNLIGQKITEREERFKKFGGSVFLLEPNLKEAEGGLRDIHLVRWLAKIVGTAETFSDLVKMALLSPDEAEALGFSFDFYHLIRNQLHRLNGRKHDQITFSFQQILAGLLGFKGDATILPVEEFMQTYYTVAFQVNQITNIIIHKTLSQRRGKIHDFFSRARARKLDDSFKIQDGRIKVAHARIFERDTASLVRVFRHVQKTGRPISFDTKFLIRKNLFRVNDDFRSHPKTYSAMSEMMSDLRGLGQALFAMHDVHFFDALIPEFRKVRNRVQHDLYHVYTVDTHSIFAVEELSKLASGAYDEKFPSYKKALLSVQRKDLLSFGLLFHDIGKGEGGNHSVIGAKMANTILSRFGYIRADQEVVEFLVISHLIMPHLSQRRDLEDPQLISEFAKSVKTLERLNMLYILTWADIRAVSAEAWTDWKGNLLTELYEKTKNVISGQELYEDYVRRRVVDVRTAILDRMKSKVDFIDLEAFLETMSPRYVMAHNDDEIVSHYKLINGYRDGTFLFHEQEIPGTSVSEVLIYTLNNPRLLPLVTGVMLALGINILVLEVFTLKNGYIFLKLSLQSAMQSSLSDGFLVERLKQDLNDVFLGVKNVNQLIAKRKKPQLLVKKAVQSAPTKIQVDNDVSAYYTVIDIYTHDRIGLLYDIIRCLAENGCYVEVSKISTKVEQVVDSFYVKDIFGQKITSKDKLSEIKAALFLVIDGTDFPVGVVRERPEVKSDYRAPRETPLS